MLLTSIPIGVNHQLESRMREIRLSGSEGGGAAGSPYPYHCTEPAIYLAESFVAQHNFRDGLQLHERGALVNLANL